MPSRTILLAEGNKITSQFNYSWKWCIKLDLSLEVTLAFNTWRAYKKQLNNLVRIQFQSI